MKIIYIENENVNRNSSGGIMTYILNLSNSLKNNGLKTVLIGSGFKNNLKSDNFNYIFSINKNYINNNFIFFINLFFSKFNFLVDKDDIIHVQRLEMSIPIFLRFSNKIVCTIHGNQNNAIKSKKNFFKLFIFKILELLSCLILKKIILVDKKNFDNYVAKFPFLSHKFHLIPISVNTNNFYEMDKNQLRQERGINLKEKIALYVGRLEKEKNVNFLINVFNKMDDDKFNLIIVGSGSELNKLKNLAKNNRRISFYGELKNEQICEILNIADVLLLCSNYEGSPNIIKESLCCNTPVIANDVGDAKEVIHKTNGGCILPLDIDLWIKEIRNISTKKFKVSEFSRQIFDLNTMVKSTRKIYNHIYEK